MTYKQQVNALAKEVASEYEDWEYVAGAFKNKTLKHTELIIRPSFSYSYGTNVNSTPHYEIKNKKVGKFLKRYGFESYNESFTWSYRFIQAGKPDNFHVNQRFYNYDIIMSKRGKRVSELKDFLRGIMDEGIMLLPEKFDFSSEEALLRSIPEVLKTYSPQRAVVLCAAKILIGDFDFIERFYNGEIVEERRFDKEKIKKILDDIPNLKKMWEEHGRIVL